MLARDDALRVLLRVAGELLIRSGQTKRHLEQIELSETGEYRQLAEAIRVALAAIEQLLPENLRTVRLVSDSGESLTAENLEVLFRFLEMFSRWFIENHELLVYLPQGSVTPESRAILKSSFGSLYTDLNPSIILGSLFNALEFDFSQLMKNRLPSFEDIEIRENANIVLQLAICDRDVPVAWSILGHELGHAIDDRFGITDKVVSKFVTDPSSAPFKFLFSWCQEFCADLLAAKALGPSPILALLSLEYCVFPLRPVFYYSDTHPSTSWRLEVVSRFLRRLYGGKDYLRSERSFYRTASLYSLERSEPDEERRRILQDIDRQNFKHVALPIAEEIQKEILLLDIPSHNLSSMSLERCVKRLKDGLPVSAQGRPKRELRKALDEYRVKVYKAREERISAFKSLAEEFKEEPLDFPAILMSGQALRSKFLTATASLEENLSDPDKICGLIERLSRLDELVSASITMSGVHRELKRKSEVRLGHAEE